MTKHKRLKTMPFSLCHIGWHGATTRVSCQAYPNRSKTKGFLYNCLSKYRGKVIYRTEDSRIDPPRFLISPAAAFEYQNKKNNKKGKKQNLDTSCFSGFFFFGDPTEKSLRLKSFHAMRYMVITLNSGKL